MCGGGDGRVSECMREGEVKIHSFNQCADEVWFGNPKNASECVHIPGIQRSSAKNSSSTPEKLAVNLLQILFTYDEIVQGNCSQPRDCYAGPN